MVVVTVVDVLVLVPWSDSIERDRRWISAFSFSCEKIVPFRLFYLTPF